MSINELPTHFNPVKICRHAPIEGTKMAGKVLLSDMNNLSDELKSQGSRAIAVELVFSVDDDGVPCIEGRLDIDLEMICQRCMKPMIQPVHSTFRVSPVQSDEQAKHLPDRYEPLLMDNQEVILSDWIAEELYLALPLVVRHELPCVSYENDNKDAQEKGDSKPISPFAVLKNKIEK